MNAENLIFLMPLLPFVGFVINGLWGRRMPQIAVSLIGCASPGIAFAVAILGFARLLGMDPSELPLKNSLGPWIQVGSLGVPMSFALDRLSGVMALVVTGVGTLIHVYSIGYMKDDPGYARYFSFLNLFMAAMLVLVLADNIVLMFLGWEGVGLCSYLLIGFWYKDLLNCTAGIKAFVVNRIGDLAFLLGMLWIFRSYGTFDFAAINAEAAQGQAGVFWIAILLFIGATGKSAQIPLFVWLPDAMAGPTPVSALIHAATMVTSGVYMVSRLEGLYRATPTAMAIVATVGALTAVLAAAIAFSQNDIKKVLAYSTVSQLGYMFLAAGVGAFGVAIFHLVTHAFFKALLFLAAGAVIHSLHHEQDMRRMGGLKDKIPHTAWLFTVGALALSGFFLTAGFFSKDQILHAVHVEGVAVSGFYGVWLTVLWIIGLITALFTAIYSFRQVALVFFGSYRGEKGEAAAENPANPGDGHGHDGVPFDEIHESPLTMRVPLYILAVLSVLGGFLFLGVPEFLGTTLKEEGEILGLILGTIVPIAGIALGLGLYLKRQDLLRSMTEENRAGRALWKLSFRKFYVDEIYDRFIVKPLFALADVLFYLVDRLIIDFLLVGGTGFTVQTFGGIFRRLQSGRVPTYAMWFLCGVLVILFLSWVHFP